VRDASSRYEIRAISRAVEILDLVEHSVGGATLGELVTGSGLTKTTVFRMVRNLEQAGLLERIEGTARYQLGLRCVGLGRSYLEQTDLRREALPILTRLRDTHNETVHLAVLDGELRVVYLEKLPARHAVGIMMSAVGRNAPAYCTGLGKALLAAHPGDPSAQLAEQGALVAKTPNTICEPDALRTELEVIRSTGFALDLEEHEVGVRCVAGTIRGPGGRPLAALSISGPADRLPQSLLRGELARAVVRAGEAISRRLGAPGGG
jgi:DNA-binding IclR family transcriptional regulator